MERNGKIFTGLSPRVRGNPAPVPHHHDVRGSIPACAGEPGRRASAGGACAVYPRVCGGTRRDERPMENATGLSPRVRGNRLLFVAEKVAGGSIPACAGEPKTAAMCWRARMVYPRVCGGTPHQATQGARPEGLSPRVRGNRPRLRLPAGGVGSIPACAGEPPRPQGPVDRVEVYPRVCGGTLLADRIAVVSPGLSPRVRGNPAESRLPQKLPGSIPACAGEPLCLPLPSAVL